MRFHCAIGYLLSGVTLMISLTLSANAEEAVSGQVKAAYLYQFIKYVRWPDRKSTIVVGVVAQNNISQQFRSIDGKSFNDKLVLIQYVAKLGEQNSCCDVLYFAADSGSQLQQWSNKLPEGVVTVADNAIENGQLGMIQLVRQATKLKFVVNNSLAKRHSVNFSSRLLRVAIRVD